MLLAIGTQEILIVLIGGGIVIGLPVYFIYKYAKQKGRLEEIERQRKEGQV